MSQATSFLPTDDSVDGVAVVAEGVAEGVAVVAEGVAEGVAGSVADVDGSILGVA